MQFLTFIGGLVKAEAIRKKVAREAAALLYFKLEKEYKQAKIKAAKILGVNFLPTNREIARELDKIAEENEGSIRQQNLVKKRREALKTMKILKAYNPILIGSVWRGTAHRESDIDIAVYHDKPDEILKVLKQNCRLKILQTERVMVTKRGQKKTSFHIYLESQSSKKIEIIVRCSEEAYQKEKCEIYNDEITGLRIKELEKILKENPTQRFLPSQN